jgi:hypothetical protein
MHKGDYEQGDESSESENKEPEHFGRPTAQLKATMGTDVGFVR